MTIKDFLIGLERIDGAIMQLIGALKATIYKNSEASPPGAEEQELNNLLKDWHPENQLERMPYFFLSESKQMSVVLPKEEEVKKYKGKTIRRRADGRWWTRFYNKEGKQISVYGKTQNECLNRLKEALRQNNRQKKEEKPTTLGDWLTKWLELYKIGKIKETSLRKIKYTIDIMQPLLDVRLGDLTAIQIQQFLNNINGGRKRELVYVTLKDAITKAVKNKLIADNPFDVVELPARKAKPSRALTADEETRFLTACEGCKEEILFKLCLYEGLRLGEALALTYDDVDFDRMQITVNKSLNNYDELTSPKTEQSNRTIPLFKRVAEMLDKNGKGTICKYSRPVYQRKMVAVCKNLGFDGISIHSLRHTFATRCAEAGIAAKVVQHWLGHSTVNMTLNVYTHVNAEFEQQSAAQIDTYFDTHFSSKSVK